MLIRVNPKKHTLDKGRHPPHEGVLEGYPAY